MVGSWMICPLTFPAEGKAIFETFSRKVADAYRDSGAYLVLTAGEYLGALNRRIRERNR
jgi:hypothetical protein